ncbi:RdgB/HAM1 family non-canonical purine NTP pyrophosphatase [Patescibacteria group bacterium]
MINTVLIATRRQGKLDEFQGILKDTKFNLKTLKEIDFPQIEPKEDGKTFKENACIKAMFYGKRTNLKTLADDSGLIVDALPGKLGVRTKRYAKGTDKDRYLKLLKDLADVKEEKRQARFVSAIAYYNPKTKRIITTRGVCEGKIALTAKGKFGFGYDPVFIVNELNKHFASLSLEEKNKVSHRARALMKMKKYLEKNI